MIMQAVEMTEAPAQIAERVSRPEGSSEQVSERLRDLTTQMARITEQMESLRSEMTASIEELRLEANQRFEAQTEALRLELTSQTAQLTQVTSQMEALRAEMVAELRAQRDETSQKFAEQMAETRAQREEAKAADEGGFPRLADWMRQAEALWEGHKQGRVTLSKRNLALIENWDYWGKLSAQFPIAPLRVVYTTSGTLPASAVIRDAQAVVDSSLYWFSASGIEEARYLTTTFNSETARERIAPLQSRGQWGARHFDKLMLTLPIPRFDGENALHLELAALAADAERVAGEVELPERAGFVKTRQIIRGALATDGVAQRIDARVAQLLG